MKILRSWISDFVDISDLSNERLEELLTTRVAEVEGVRSDLTSLSNVIVAKIEQVSAHPNSENLFLLKLNLGSELIEVVCGDKTCKIGEVVPYAQVGARIFKSKAQDEPELVKIEQRQVAGVLSKGLLVSEAELGLGPDNESVLRLTPEYLEGAKLENIGVAQIALGKAINDYFKLDDVVIEIDNKSLTHRPDLWGHFGFARELSALLGRELKYNPDSYSDIEFTDPKSRMQVKIDAGSACRRFSVQCFEGVNNGKSPLWLRQRLFRVGSNSKNLVVDLSNYVMRDIGQPNHTYDLSLLSENTFIVRKAKQGEVFTALDDKSYELSSDDIAIADSKRVLALGGIIGGKETAISELSTAIALESANFDPIVIRKSAKRHALRTDASNRFEKSQSALSVPLATKRFTELLSALNKDLKIIDQGSEAFIERPQKIQIPVNLPYIRERLGKELPDSNIEKILCSLGLKKSAENWEVPYYRATRDLAIADDLVEEVGRIIGYENVPEQVPVIQSNAVNLPSPLRQDLTTFLKGKGFSEVYNYSFVDPELSKQLGYPCSEGLKLKNPIDTSLSCVRSSLVPSMIEALNSNLKNFDKAALFEFGRAYKAVEKKSTKDSGAVEKQYLCLALSSGSAEKLELTNYQPAVRRGVDFYSAITIVRAILGQAPLEVAALEIPLPWMHPYRQAELKSSGLVLGYVAELMPDLLDTQRAVIIEIDYENLTKVLEQSKSETHFKHFSRYPSSFFEISVVMPERDNYNLLENIIKKSVTPSLLKKIEVLSVYQGKPLEQDQKSVSVKLFLGSDQGTLSAEQVTNIQSTVMSAVNSSIYTLRS